MVNYFVSTSPDSVELLGDRAHVGHMILAYQMLVKLNPLDFRERFPGRPLTCDLKNTH